MTVPQRTKLTVIEHDNGAPGITFTYTVPANATATVTVANVGTGNGYVAAASPAGITLWSVVSSSSAGAPSVGVKYTSIVGSAENIQLPSSQPTSNATTTWSGPQLLGPGSIVTVAGANAQLVAIESQLVG